MSVPEESQVDDIETLEDDDETSGGNFLAAVNGIHTVRDQVTGYVELDSRFSDKDK